MFFDLSPHLIVLLVVNLKRSLVVIESPDGARVPFFSACDVRGQLLANVSNHVLKPRSVSLPVKL
jgi:hypothetical protein